VVTDREGEIILWLLLHVSRRNKGRLLTYLNDRANIAGMANEVGVHKDELEQLIVPIIRRGLETPSLRVSRIAREGSGERCP